MVRARVRINDPGAPAAARGERGRRSAWGTLLAFCSALLLATLLSACSSPSGNLDVSVKANDGTDIKPGDTPSFTASVINRGPTAASGVSVRVDLPAEFRYKSTMAITGDGDARTQPVDAGGNNPSPVWGLWSLSAPVVNADGSVRLSRIDVRFVVNAAGQPGDYPMVPRASSDATDGLVAGPALGIHVSPSTKLTMTLVPIQTTVSPGNTVDYRLIITNDGSGVASNLGVLITLPPAFQFGTTIKVSGNAARSSPTDPVRGAVVPFYGGYTLPARSSVGPGILTIQFRVSCVPAATGGSFGTTAQLTDADGAVVSLADVARVAVNAPIPTPVPPPTAQPTPTVRGQNPSPVPVPAPASPA